MTYYPNYDAWKLSNPWDDGHYNEDEDPTPIQETTFFKYVATKWWVYGMITEEGYDVRVHQYDRVPTINVDEIEPTQDDLDDELHRVRMNYTQFAYIDQDEFMEQYNIARQFMDKIIAHETGN